MNKKWMAALLALVMVVGMGSLALASSPSITTDDLTSEEVTPDQAAIDAIGTFIGSGEGTAADYFGADVKDAIASLLPAGISADDLELYEVVAADTTAYTEDQLKAGITLRLPTAFQDGDTVIVLVGVPDGQGGVVWTPVKATVSNGQLTLKFPAKLAASFVGANEPAIFAVLGAK